MAVKSIEYRNTSFEIAYDIVNPTAEKTIVFLHGWGSNKEIMKQAFATTLKNFKHIYIDMPGFGKSPNNTVLATKDYAHIVQSFLEKTTHHLPLTTHNLPLTIAGHSFGGKVATLLNPQNLVLLSSAGIVEEKPLIVKFKIKLAKFLNLFGLGKLTKAFRSKDVNQMNQAMYETFKNVVNEDFTQVFENYKGKAYIFWGKEDTATTLSSGEKIHALIQNSEFVSYNGDHYFFIKNAHDITQRLDNGIL
ncbi:MAG: alpha/beta hydrolase [Sulfurimonadaceae bacterium]